jgi:flagellar basal body-associated protein FliL
MSIPLAPTVSIRDLPESQGERPLQKLLLIILITICMVLVGGGVLLYYLSKSKEAGTQVASTSTPSSSRVESALRFRCVLPTL